MSASIFVIVVDGVNVFYMTWGHLWGNYNSFGLRQSREFRPELDEIIFELLTCSTNVRQGPAG